MLRARKPQDTQLRSITPLGSVVVVVPYCEDVLAIDSTLSVSKWAGFFLFKTSTGRLLRADSRMLANLGANLGRLLAIFRISTAQQSGNKLGLFFNVLL